MKFSGHIKHEDSERKETQRLSEISLLILAFQVCKKDFLELEHVEDTGGEVLKLVILSFFILYPFAF